MNRSLLSTIHVIGALGRIRAPAFVRPRPDFGATGFARLGSSRPLATSVIANSVSLFLSDCNGIVGALHGESEDAHQSKECPAQGRLR